MLRVHKSGFIIILVFCLMKNISSLPQRKLRENDVSNAPITAINQTTNSTAKAMGKFTESYLPATMQALAYYIELLQYEPVHMTTIEPQFTLSTTPLTLSNSAVSSSTQRPPLQQPVTWWSSQATPTWTQRPPTIAWTTSPWTTKKPVTWWSPPSTTTHKPTYWVQHESDSTGSSDQKPPSPLTSTPIPISTSSPAPSPPITHRPLVSTTTPSWWHQETTPFHEPGNIAPEPPKPAAASIGSVQHAPKPNAKPQIGDLAVLSISNHPYFEHFVSSNSKTFEKKAEYEFLHQLPAELLQDIENEPYEPPKGTDQEMANEFRRVYDDFFTRVRIFAPITGKKRIPPTRPYVLFLILYDLCKREAKRLGLQEYTGYSEEMLARLHETSQYSAERQLYTLMDELLQQKTIIAEDFKMRVNEIMIDLANPNSVTAKALHILPPLQYEF